MDKLFDVLEKMGALWPFFPLWVRAVFAVGALSIIVSFIIWIAQYPTALQRMKERQELDKVGIDVSVSSRATKSQKSAEPKVDGALRVTYQASSDATGIVISPKLAYLDLVAKGGPVSTLSYWDLPFAMSIPNLDLKIVNNDKQTYFFTGVIFDVERSEPDNEPVIVLHHDISRMNPRHIEILNEGWGKVLSPSIRFIVSATPFHPAIPLNLEEKANEIHFDAFYRHANVDLSREIESAGANLSRLSELAGCKEASRSDPSGRVTCRSGNHTNKLTRQEYKRELWKAFGPFTNNTAYVQGELSYSTTESPTRKTLAFTASVGIMRDLWPGAPTPPSYRYETLLKSEGAAYSVNVPIAQALKAGEVDRFNISVAAPKSSVHHFRLRLIYNGGKELVSPPIELRIFMPQSAASKLIGQQDSGH